MSGLHALLFSITRMYYRLSVQQQRLKSYCVMHSMRAEKNHGQPKLPVNACTVHVHTHFTFKLQTNWCSLELNSTVACNTGSAIYFIERTVTYILWFYLCTLNPTCRLSVRADGCVRMRNKYTLKNIIIS